MAPPEDHTAKPQRGTDFLLRKVVENAPILLWAIDVDGNFPWMTA